ncbi:uncharacterized protein ACA1_067850 [Acanthamoeba castellanii str. Neff]|uniref:MOSC domain containing protein n=1 Tax=Acanthamoeba castellanii (strain ATCC 30010 / Neff) TaxID=1257118 RepID=L8HFK4_ACACF|nr:uncharacterized protein ACA1_067850 [Acanthamoeba castellanii str. Neff]ELR23201.1 hypothetical protein ACA1_067850 [Acanthamoeba castellanii str. Neff]
MEGKVVALFVSPERGVRNAVDLVRVFPEGLEGDRFRREVLLVDEETLLEAGMQVGGMKENITVRGLGLGQSEPGARFRVGADLVFEVGQKLACVGEDPALTGKRGVFVRLTEGEGVIHKGDGVQRL